MQGTDVISPMIIPCKVSQRDMIALKFKLDVSWHLPDVYTRFQVHISKHVQKAQKTYR